MEELPRSKELKSIVNHLKDYPEEQRIVRTLLTEKYMDLNNPVMQLAYISINLGLDVEFLASSQLTSDCIELCQILGVNVIEATEMVRNHAKILNKEMVDILIKNNHKEVN